MVPLVHQPGEGWLYHTGSDVLGVLIARATGKSLGAFLAERIFGPLGMNDTGFIITERQRARQARLQRRGADGRLVAQPFEKLETPAAFSGGGGIYSTAPDYLRLLQALLNGGSLDGAKILKAETVSQMALNQIGNIEAEHFPSPSCRFVEQPPHGAFPQRQTFVAQQGLDLRFTQSQCPVRRPRAAADPPHWIAADPPLIPPPRRCRAQRVQASVHCRGRCVPPAAGEPRCNPGHGRFVIQRRNRHISAELTSKSAQHVPVRPCRIRVSQFSQEIFYCRAKQTSRTRRATKTVQRAHTNQPHHYRR